MDIDDIRDNIDVIDDELVSLFLARMECSMEIARAKEEGTLPVEDKSREREILERVRARSGDRAPYADRFFRSIFSLSRAYQEHVLGRDSRIGEEIAEALRNSPEAFPRDATVAVQGIEGAYSQLAADRIFPLGRVVYVRTFEAVCSAVESGLCDFGILPFENSSNGSVRTVNELLRTRHVHVVRSARLWIRHELLGKPGTTIDQITEIRSHTQALGQCSTFLNSLKNVRKVPFGNTAEAARSLAEVEDNHAGAIASEYCGELYGLEPIVTDISNSANNYTRFAVISKDAVIYPGANRILLAVVCKHEPGALHDVMERFTALGINLLKLESCPIVGHDFEFLFFFEIEASVKDPHVIAMLGDIERSTEDCVLLGSFQEV